MVELATVEIKSKIVSEVILCIPKEGDAKDF